MAPFDRSHTSSYSPSIVTMAISCIVCEIQRLIGRKSRNLYTPLVFSAPVGVTPSDFREDVWCILAPIVAAVLLFLLSVFLQLLYIYRCVFGLSFVLSTICPPVYWITQDFLTNVCAFNQHFDDFCHRFGVVYDTSYGQRLRDRLTCSQCDDISRPPTNTRENPTPTHVFFIDNLSERKL